MVKVSLQVSSGLMDRIKNAPVKLKKEISAEIQLSGERLTELAVKDLSSGMLTHPTGSLAGSIRPEKTGELTVEVVAHKEYAPYIEWGTITRVQVPSELSSYAMQFKGKGIKKNGGIYPRPYFFKQVPIVRKETEDRIINILSSLYD